VRVTIFLAIGMAAAALSAQPSIQTSGNIETAKQLVSTQAQGTAPLVVFRVSGDLVQLP